MLYIYRRAASEGATLLAEDIMLKGVRARRTQGRMLRENLRANDVVICWGEQLPDNLPVHANQLRVLNNKPVINKLTEAQTLARAGVATVQVSQTRPAPVARPPYLDRFFSVEQRNEMTARDAMELANRLNQFAAEELTRRREYEAQPLITETWLPRRNNHVGGSDLLRTPTMPDYYSKKENIVEEYRLHMFRGKSIRAGRKTQRPTRPDGVTPSHPWIRSFDAGWIIAYEGFQSTRQMRELAKSALEALGLDFAAVDMALTADGRLIVLEVNRAPGVEGGTSEAYATHIVNWFNGEQDAD